MLIRILLAIDPPSLASRLERLLAQMNVLVLPVASWNDLWVRLGQESSDLVVVSRSLIPSSVPEALAPLRKLPDRPEIVVLQEREEAEDRAALLMAGCLAVLSPRLSDPVLTDTLRALVRRRREALVDGLRLDAREEVFRLRDFVSASPAMREMLDLAERVAQSDSSLLILGETGVGKEWLARAIHAEGARGGSPFIAVNCAAIPDSLLESELFGHERGAFTGAIRSRRGYFELAHRGTLFLDEVAEMSPHLQVKLLRVLQERRIQRLGAEEPIRVDVRILAATNRDLEKALVEGSFRRDLYYRLGVVTLTIPPLRERPEDIPALLHSYLERIRTRLGRNVQGFRQDALDALVAYLWPGNVRELINVVERAVLLARGPEITPAELPQGLSAGDAAPPVPPLEATPGAEVTLPLPSDWLGRPLRALRREMTQALERTYLAALLEATGGRVGETAKRAGMGPRSLHEKMKRLGLRKEAFR